MPKLTDSEILAPPAPLNITVTLRDDDTGIDATQKLHIYGSDGHAMLRSISRSLLELLQQIGLTEGVEDGNARSRSRSGEIGRVN